MEISIISMVQLDNPLIWALIIGWVLSLSIHEFAHGIVAHYGGDYTISERGGLTLNPFQFLNPISSLVMPLIFLMLGGLPLPGGATYVRTDLLKSRRWESMVSLAGPASNFIIYLLLCIIIHPMAGWVEPSAHASEWTTPQKFVGCLAFLQLYAVVLNMLPIPPFDGFGSIRPYLPRHIHDQIMAPPIPTICTLTFFFLIFYTPLSSHLFMFALRINQALGFSINIPIAFQQVLFNR
jgi:Zn-dependent protease